MKFDLPMTLACWQEFMAPAPRPDELWVTIDAQGTITLGAKTVRRMNSPEVVILYFDTAKLRIGIRPTFRPEPNTFPVKPKAKGDHRVIRASRFCRHFGIWFDRTHLFTDAHIDESGVLVLDLALVIGVGRTQKRSGPKSRR